MPRRSRRLQGAQEACYHLMDRGHDRQPIFADDQDRHAFLDLVARYAERFGFQIYHYCLMTNHIHFLVQLQDPRDVSPLMAGLLRAYVHHCDRQYGFVGHRFQGRFKSPAVQGEGYLLSCGRYIERNPLEAGLVARPWDYAWSSARFYGLGVPDPLLADNPYYLELSPAEKQSPAKVAGIPFGRGSEGGGVSAGRRGGRGRSLPPPRLARAGSTGTALPRTAKKEREAGRPYFDARECPYRLCQVKWEHG